MTPFQRALLWLTAMSAWLALIVALDIQGDTDWLRQGIEDAPSCFVQHTEGTITISENVPCPDQP